MGCSSSPLVLRHTVTVVFLFIFCPHHPHPRYQQRSKEVLK